MAKKNEVLAFAMASSSNAEVIDLAQKSIGKLDMSPWESQESQKKVEDVLHVMRQKNLDLSKEFSKLLQ